MALRLGVGLTFFVAGLAVEIRGISKSGQPMLRAVPAMATVTPLFLVVLAWLYLTYPEAGIIPISRGGGSGNSWWRRLVDGGSVRTVGIIP